MTSEIEVVVIGNAGIDTNVYLPGQEIDFTVEANFTENKDCIGQAGGFASLGYAQLGYKTAYTGYLGEDFQGYHIRSVFSRQGINMQATFVDPAGTARSVNFMYPDGRRKNFYDGKSHMQLKPDLAVCQPVVENVRLAHFNIPNWARDLLPLVKTTGATIACDIQDVIGPGDPYRQDFIQYADILFFSAANLADLDPILRSFHSRNPEQVIIAGMGAQGCATFSKQGLQYFAAVDLHSQIVDTNGAGDSLAVGFLTSYVIEGYSLEDSILRGQIAARHACSLKANSDALINSEQLNYWFTKLKNRKDR